jgi:hypothetical protein
MIALSLSNSLNTLPTRFIACIDAASFGLIDTVWALPTLSRLGTNTLRTTTSPIQPRTISGANLWTDRAKIGMCGSPAARLSVVMPTSLCRRFGHSFRSPTFHL